MTTAPTTDRTPGASRAWPTLTAFLALFALLSLLALVRADQAEAAPTTAGGSSTSIDSRYLAHDPAEPNEPTAAFRTVPDHPLFWWVDGPQGLGHGLLLSWDDSAPNDRTRWTWALSTPACHYGNIVATPGADPTTDRGQVLYSGADLRTGRIGNLVDHTTGRQLLVWSDAGGCSVAVHQPLGHWQMTATVTAAAGFGPVLTFTVQPLI